MNINCDCPVHWVICFKRDCPRGRQINEWQQQAVEEARRLLGDPTKCVSPETENGF